MDHNILTSHFISKFDISVDFLSQQLQKTQNYCIDYADIFLQTIIDESWSLEDNIIKNGSYNIDNGIGVRTIHNEKTAFAYADEISPFSIRQAIDSVIAIAKQGKNQIYQVPVEKKFISRYKPINPLETLTQQEKFDLLHKMNDYCRQKEPKIKEVMITLVGNYEEVCIIATDGTFAVDIRPLIRLNCLVVLEDKDKNKTEKGYAGMGGRYSYTYFLEKNAHHQEHALALCDEAIEQALINLEAKEAPAGEMSVILGNGWPAVLLHEAVGHGLEGDFNRKGSSLFSNKIGEQVASKQCTVIDDGTLPNLRGSLSIDDEGTPSQYNILIENGILKNYMQDKLNAKLMKQEPTGNGRRESYAHIPMPRMTNTYMLSGQYAPEEIIASVKKGIYAPHFAGGQVDITSGQFVFSTSEAYMIENGKISYPIKNATLIGNGPHAMHQISMVGNDLQIDKGIGICGKSGQSVPVGVGQPTIKLDKLTVGGTQ